MTPIHRLHHHHTSSLLVASRPSHDGPLRVHVSSHTTNSPHPPTWSVYILVLQVTNSRCARAHLPATRHPPPLATSRVQLEQLLRSLQTDGDRHDGTSSSLCIDRVWSALARTPLLPLSLAVFPYPHVYLVAQTHAALQPAHDIPTYMRHRRNTTRSTFQHNST